ncbi:hypothetical protein A3A21_01835 [Candidatus Jorgensenbacteria bacterium RIFCSPLOWO2_01_FULL_45_25b]|uniref:Four helix bundle protein n=1 Tax=Candidatus Jorgensenbacteria bacterium RIFCSPLOWO2_01_FULL_45_25b TaxID=1798471 RepID=A0A1F6BUV3_9BACT|nr:MAG: hypothetical protein A3A21_01835 [Candidatus Jorgensenbacteria bacterium RIFCSPLOWO2_01_FULL_45_25b]
MHTYRDLIVWQKSIELVVEIYKITDEFPKEEIYGLTSQMRRSAVSIASNIAEGKLRGYKKEQRQFLLNAFGSGGELETQITITKRLFFGRNLDFSKSEFFLEEVMKMLNKMITIISNS